MGGSWYSLPGGGKLRCMKFERPSEADYTTSTNPERFEAVVGYAENLIAESESKYVIDRAEGDWSEDFPRLANFNDNSAAPVRLTPSTGAPLVFGFTSAPGVVLRVGPTVQELFPDCLCDACNSQVSDECANLQMHVDAVASGGFTDELTRRRHRWRFRSPMGNETLSVSRLARGEWKHLGARGTRQWEPWTLRRA